jgi:hypothetical protein
MHFIETPIVFGNDTDYVCQTFRSDQETDGLGKLFETYAVASGCSEVFDYYKEGSN